jgi:diguanylate cyclase (GGDEF)-like protein
MNRKLPLLTLKGLLGVVVCCFVVATCYISYVIAERQGALRKVSRYNEAWTVGQTLAEYMRLEHQLAAFGLGGTDVDLDEVRLRLDIMFGRLQLLEQGMLHEFVRDDPQRMETVADLRHALETVDLALRQDPPVDVRPGLKTLAALDAPMTMLASQASEYGSKRIAADQAELEQLHLIFSGLAGGLIVCGVCLIGILLQNNRLLNRAHLDLKRLTDNLQGASAELLDQNHRLAHVAHHDALTGLPNRVLFREWLDARFSSRDETAGCAVLFLDLDGFKDVNDTLGHDMGDALLKAVAERLRRATKAQDLVCRLGGDEFAVLGDGLNEEQALDLGRHLLAEIASLYVIGDREIIIATSIGIALMDAASSADELLKKADLALYEAKGLGRGRVSVFRSEMHARLEHKRAFETDLRKALINGEMEVFYQPQADAVTRAVQGYEALLRWKHPVRGQVPPCDFIPVAEEIGMINMLGEWVLKTACAEAASWPQDLKIAVNLSPIQFRSKSLLQTIVGALAYSGLDPWRLEVEITESVLLDADERTADTLNGLRQLGITIAMDDFGTGYSSLGNLRRFSFNKIKIDKSFVQDIAIRPDAMSIVSLVVGVAKSLQMAVTAEGIETEEQLQCLKQLGCEQVQGYLIGRPAPPSQLAIGRREPAAAPFAAQAN